MTASPIDTDQPLAPKPATMAPQQPNACAPGTTTSDNNKNTKNCQTDILHPVATMTSLQPLPPLMHTAGAPTFTDVKPTKPTMTPSDPVYPKKQAPTAGKRPYDPTETPANPIRHRATPTHDRRGPDAKKTAANRKALQDLRAHLLLPATSTFKASATVASVNKENPNGKQATASAAAELPASTSYAPSTSVTLATHLATQLTALATNTKENFVAKAHTTSHPANPAYPPTPSSILAPGGRLRGGGRGGPHAQGPHLSDLNARTPRCGKISIMAPIHKRREALAREQFTRGSQNTDDTSSLTHHERSTEYPYPPTLSSPPSSKSEDMQDGDQSTIDPTDTDPPADNSILSQPSFQSDDMQGEEPASSPTDDHLL